MRTNIVLDRELVTWLLEDTGFKTKRQLVDEALREYARMRKLEKFLALRGKIEWEGDLDQDRQADADRFSTTEGEQ